MQQVTTPTSPAPTSRTRSFVGSDHSINCNVNNNNSASNAFRSLTAQWSNVFGSRTSVHDTNNSLNSLSTNTTLPSLPKGSMDHFYFFLVFFFILFFLFLFLSIYLFVVIFFFVKLKSGYFQNTKTCWWSSNEFTVNNQNTYEFV